MIGLRNFFRVAADIPVTNSVVLVTTGLTSPIAANQSQKIRAWIPVTVGATGGVRAQIVVPAGGTLFEATFKLYNTVAAALVLGEQQASAAFTNALANAGDHWLEVEAMIVNGATAGNVDIQMAQNTADALTMTISAGGSMEVVKF